MDVTIVIATMLVLSIAVVVMAMSYLMKVSNKREEQLLIDQVQEYEDSSQNIISEKDSFNKRFMGITHQGEHLLYISHEDGGNYQRSEIPVRAITKTNLQYESLNMGYTDEEKTRWDLLRIRLRLHLNNGNPANIVFYDEVRDGPSARHAHNTLAKKWKQIIEQAVEQRQ